MNKLGHRFSNFAFSLLATVTILIGSVPLVPTAYGIQVNTGINEAGEWHRAGPGVVMRETNEPGEDIYIVRHQAPSLAQYRGDIPGLAPTSPVATGAARLDTDSAASVAYLAYLEGLHNNLQSDIATRIGRNVEVVHRYDVVLNGIAVRMTATEAQQVSSMAGIRSITRDFKRELQTDSGPRWIGADAVWGEDPPTDNVHCVGTCGEGIVVGIIDTGVNFNHPSFAEVGGDGYEHSNPRVHPITGLPQFFGACASVAGLCNNKLIGYYDFTGTGPEDDHGHGSHTASTTAGNVLNITLEGVTINLERAISGVAPHANIISYKGCSGTPAGCQLSALLAAITKATDDEVDVINYSIGGGSANPWEDVDAQAFFDAYTAGIFVATSASNDGPGYATLGSPADAPWVTSVGASTHDRQIANRVADISPALDGGDTEVTGAGITAGYPSADYPHLDGSGASHARIVYAGDYPADRGTTPHLCGAGAANAADGSGADGSPWNPGTFNGEIVLCERGEYGRVFKGQYAKDAGAGGYILMNDPANGESLVADNHVLPGVHISNANGERLKDLIAANGGSMSASPVDGRISGMVPGEDPGNADIMASFSSRGANPAAPSLIKPDVTAPGVDILAAWMASPEVTLQDILLQSSDGEQYNIISGTSMSSPHTAGAGALIRAMHPDWSPDEVKSALMTTAFVAPPGNGGETHPVYKEDGATLADPFDMGAGRVDLHVAANAGFILNETPENYDAANPSVGGDATTLNIASLGQDFCPSACTWTRTIESTAPGSVTWNVSGSSADGLDISVSPASFTLTPGATQTLTITASVENVTNTTAQGWAFGDVLFTNSAGVPPAHFPVAVKPEAGGGVKFYLHGNTHDSNDVDRDCTGNGNADAADETGCRPFLSEDETQETAPPAAYSQTTGLDCVPNENSTCLHDPNWIWKLDGATALQGPMQFGFWFANSQSNPGLAEDFDIKIWADGALVFEERFRADNEITQVGPVPYYMTGTTTLPLMNAAEDFLFIIDPVFVNQQGSVLYDSQAPCPGKLTGSCESFVTLPVINRPQQPPVATDDNAFVTNGGSVSIDVLANDFDPEGGSLAVKVLTAPVNGTAEVDQFHAVTYSHNGSPTTSDSFTYEITDNQGLKDTATVNISVGGVCQIAGGTAAYDFETLADQGWTVDTAVQGASIPWTLTPDADAPSSSTVWYTDASSQADPGQGDVAKDDRLISPTQLVSGNSILSFSHKYLTEPGADGGILEVLVDGETSWQDIQAAGGVFISGGYDGALTDPSLKGWSGFSPSYPAYSDVQVHLGSLAGKSIQVRFRMWQDQYLGVPALTGGWWVDDVAFSNLLIDDPDCNPDEIVAADDSDKVNEGEQVVTDVTANDSDPSTQEDLTGTTHQVTIVNGASWGSTTVNPSTLEVTYKHTGDPYVSGIITDSYVYELKNNNNGETDTATVTIDINPAPRAEDDSGTVDAAAAVEIDVRDNDRDLNDGKMALSVSVDGNGGATYGTVSVTGPGTVEYQHNSDPVATEDMFTYTVTDPDGATSSATVTITIVHDTSGGDTCRNDLCADDDSDKPAELTFTYKGGRCDSSSNSQGGKSDCVDEAGHDGTEASVYIRASNKEDDDADSAKVYFAGTVAQGDDFTVSSMNADANDLGSKIFVHIYTADGATLLQTIEIHTSCSAALVEGERFGSLMLGDKDTKADDPICTSGEGRVHGSGYWDTDDDTDSDSDSDKIDFSFDAKVYKGGYKGKLKIRDKYVDLKIDAKTITSLSTGTGEVCDMETLDGNNTFLFTAVGKFELGDDEVEDAEFRACGTDNGKNNEAPYDRFYVECIANCVIPYNTANGNNDIDGGNIHLHDAIKDPVPAQPAASQAAAPAGEEPAASESGAPAEQGSAPNEAPAQESSYDPEAEPDGSPDVVTLEPMLVTSVPAGTPMVVTAIAEMHGGVSGSTPVTLHWTTAAGLKGQATSLANANGIAAFVVTMPAGDVTYTAKVGDLKSNSMRVNGF